jgi:Domain of unknown function (DUF4232)
VKRLTTLLVFAGAVIASTASASSAVAFCKGSQLSGTFAAVANSAGAGNISYRLALKNISSTQCAVTGLPQGRLLGKTSNPLPTHIIAGQPGALTAVLVRLAPGHKAYATARFSPDVPGPGEHTLGQCEAKSWYLRVTAKGGGTTKVKVAPPTPVCEHGQLQFKAYSSTPN